MPAGLSCARQLRAKGNEVVVLEGIADRALQMLQRALTLAVRACRPVLCQAAAAQEHQGFGPGGHS